MKGLAYLILKHFTVLTPNLKHLSILILGLGALLFSACQYRPARSQSEPDESISTGSLTPFICPDAGRYAGQVVGDGHCVSLIKLCSGAPHTNAWKPGPRVMPNRLRPGTIIATFENGRYPSYTGYHAAIYISHDEDGIWVWDQWIGKPVHRRLIRTRHDGAPASNTAQEYRIVTVH